MKHFNVNGKVGRFTVNLPESIEEIPVDYLSNCTNHIHCAPNYAVVAIVYKDSLALVLSAAKKAKPTSISVVPLFIRAGETDSEFIKNFNVGDKCVIAASDLSIGHHINSPYNKITPESIVRLCEGDTQIYKDAITMQTPVCFIEFKIVPINAIKAKLDNTKNSFENPFVNKSMIDTFPNYLSDMGKA